MHERRITPDTDGDGEHRLVPVLLLVILATGIIDATCLLHLGVFTAYMTGSLILFGAHLVGATGTPWPSAVAVASFVVGAAIGARALRRRPATARAVVPVLAVVAVLVLAAAIVAAVVGIDDRPGELITVGVLAVAMGIQIAAVRHVAVPDLAMAAATVVLYNLVADSPVGGGTRTRSARRLGVIAALVAGAAIGAGIARWQPAAAWATAAAVLAVATSVAATGPPSAMDALDDDPGATDAT